MGERMKLGLMGGVLAAFGVAICFAKPQTSPSISIDPAKFPRAGTVDERFQSYNIEMVEVTGGRFWKPYASNSETTTTDKNVPAGMDPSLYEYRQPIDLYNARLRKLAAALGPAYVRVSGTWANTTYFQNSDEPAPAEAPAGFKGVLTRKEWKGVVDFSRATNAEIVTSFSVGQGTRDAAGVWTPGQAKQFVAYTRSLGGNIAAAEYMNEPTFAEIGGVPNGYDAVAFGKDLNVFRAFAKESAPGMLVLGPGGVGEGGRLAPSSMHLIPSESILGVTGSVYDGFSYHSYGGVSSRCGGGSSPANTTAEAALSEEWLGRSEKIEQFYRALRDRFAPGKPIWLTETAQAACGGDRWASTFVDSFRYLNQLGILAKRGVQVHMHNTLAASDYGLIDEKTLEPRPNYWVALLWRKLMGTTVLDAGISSVPNLHIYAHCLRGRPGGVALLAINTDRAEMRSIEIPVGSERYTLTAENLLSQKIQLNGSELNLGAGDLLLQLKGAPTHPGEVALPPASIAFLALPGARNASCHQ